ncbi:MAG: AzlD domain-containing protein [Thermodesulfobacteriota bacterium]
MASEPLASAASSILAIGGMALATYLTRAAGLFVATRVRLTPRAEAFLQGIPGAVLISIVLPGLTRGGPAEWAAAAVSLGLALKTRNLLVAMLAGVAVVWALRQAGG